MGWIAAAIAFAAVATAGANIYSAEKAEESTEEAIKAQTSATHQAEARQEALQAEARKAAAEKEKLLKDEEARTSAAAAAKEARSAELAAEALERQRSGRRELLSTGPETWETQPVVGRKTLLGA
jgi:hypothetical protein